MRHDLPRLLILTMLVTIAGCASRATTARSWSPQMAALFSDSSLKPDEVPREKWSRDEEDQLLRQMGFADTVAVGTLRLVSQYAPRDTPRQLALAFRADEVLHGSLDKELDDARELTLRLDPSSREFRLALHLQQQLPGARFVLFLKHNARGELHWACYRPSAQLLVELRTRFAWLARRPAG